MNREIKFRAWDNELKEMFDVAELHMVKLGERQISAYVLDKCVAIYRDEIEVMQFTGLHDKNGKEIYEGDVVRLRRPFKGTLHRRKVEWIENESTQQILPGIGWNLHGGPNQYEVIGNIYESPNLLAQ